MPSPDPRDESLAPDLTGSVSRRGLIERALWTALLSGSGISGLFDRAAAQQAEADGVIDGFTPDAVKKLAEKFSQRAFAKPAITLPEPFGRLTYDQYRDIRFRTDHAIWRGEKLEHELQLFPLGFIYDVPVEIWILEGQRATQLKADGTLFQIGPLIPNAPQAAPFGFSGFRVHGPVNRAEVFDEYTVFQGASYLRAVGRGNLYGVSARGLAINVARPGGEEFPFFRAFYIEKPRPGSFELVVHALLDSPSCVGAYRYVINQGRSIVMDVDVTLYPRRDIPYVGMAPLTSMFLSGGASPRQFQDYRPSIHDSDGLAMLTGAGERIWRPLTNPRQLQSSAFLDNNPRGFGLSQRERQFSAYEDLDAHYEKRPTVWVEPKGQWGAGTVELIEIPVDQEIHDNIVAYWRPARSPEAQKPVAFSYRLTWGDSVPVVWSGLRTRNTRLGPVRKGLQQFVVDFDGPELGESKEFPVPDVKASTGTVQNVVIQKNSETGGFRVSFDLNPSGADLIELRLVLRMAAQAVSESWLYRWTKS